VRYRTRLLIFFGSIGFLCFLVVPVRLLQLQILNRGHYAEMVEDRRIRTDAIDAPRGKIVTSDGIVLACDSPAYDLQILFRAVEDEAATVTKLASALREPREETAQRLEELRQRMVRNRLEEARRDARAGRRLRGFKYRLAERLRLSSASRRAVEEALPDGLYLRQRTGRTFLFFKRPLDEYDLWIDYAELEDVGGLEARIVKCLPVDRKRLTESVQESRDTLCGKILQRRGPRTLIANLSFGTMARVAMVESETPGVQIACRAVRRYPQGALIGQMLGTVAEPREDQLKKWLRDSENVWIRRWARSGVKPRSNAFFFRGLNEELSLRGLRLDDMVGRSGIECVFDDYLRGERGQRLVERDFRNRVQDVLGEAESRAGHNVVLTIDHRLQRFLHDEFDRDAGAAIFMDVRTGAILAAASFPTFDPNELTPHVSQETADRIFQNPLQPVLNRVLSSHYPLGSIFKILTSICVLEEGTISTGTEIDCRGALFSSHPHRFRCWARYGHGRLAIREAIQRSCNVFFYTCADRAGQGPIAEWAQEFEFGTRPGTELRRFESPGLVPTPEWKRPAIGEPWYRGDTRNLSIGQGYLTVTPLQVVRLIAAVANGGTLPPARLVSKVVTEDGQPVPFENDLAVRSPRKIHVSATTLATVRQGLHDVVNTRAGTAHKAFGDSVLPYLVAGKTSTAQTGRPDGNAGWFAGYFPASKPRIAFAVVAEGLHRSSPEDEEEEHGGDVAAPIVRRVLERYETEKSAPLTAAKE